MPQNYELAWLAGIIDGEGCFSIFRNTRKRPDGQSYASTSASIQITNSCAALMQKARGILDELGLKYTYFNPSSSTNRLVMRVEVRNYSSILKLLDTVGVYVIGKAEQARLMRDFCERASIRKGFGSPEEREEYRAKMSDLNKFGQLIL